MRNQRIKCVAAHSASNKPTATIISPAELSVSNSVRAIGSKRSIDLSQDGSTQAVVTHSPMLESKQQAHGAAQPSHPADKTPLAQKLASSTGADESAKWLQKFLESSAFLRLPASNLQALVARMDEVPARQGQVIIHQGARANNYYIVKAGSCQVLRQTQNSEHPIQLAVLQAGDGFGEDALITRGRRNASVIMLEDGHLVRLSRHNFTSLLVNPVLTTVSLEQALQRAEQHGAKILDVRAPHDFRRNSPAGSINIPLALLRANLTNLDPNIEYVAYCNSGTLSAAAAFVLAQHGYNCLYVDDGAKPKATRKIAPAAAPESSEHATNAPQTKRATKATHKKASGHIDEASNLLWTNIPLPKEFDQSKLHVVEPHAELSKACTQRNTSVRCLETQEDVAWAQSWEKSPTRAAQVNPRPDVSIPNWTSTRYTWETIMGYGESRAARFDRKPDPENASPIAVTQRQATKLTLSEKASANHIEHKKVALRSLLMMRHRARITIAALLSLTAGLVTAFPDSAKLSLNWAMEQVKSDRLTSQLTILIPNPEASGPAPEASSTEHPTTTRQPRPVVRKSHTREQVSNGAAAAPHPHTETTAADIF